MIKKKTEIMTEIMANGYSSESAQRRLSNEYQHDRVWMVLKTLCIFLWTVASAWKGLTINSFSTCDLSSKLSDHVCTTDAKRVNCTGAVIN